jgi:hypothetical protein
MGALALIPWRATAGGQKTDRPSQEEISRELQRLHDEDQKDQEADVVDEAFFRRQTVRRDRVREILALGLLGSTQDWANAAWLLQHGDTPEDYCLAHALSLPPAIEGLPLGGFAVAATLDRFLESIEREQIFGTQMYTPRPDPTQPFAGDRSIPESIRRLLALDPLPAEPGADGKRDRKLSAKELPKLLKQARKPAEGGAPEASAPDWLVQVRALVASGALESAKDHALAAEVLLHAREADDLLLGHVCALAAAVLKHEDGLRLAAETQDRFLLACGRAQAFGTAVGADGKVAEPAGLAPEVIRRGYGLSAGGKQSRK